MVNKINLKNRICSIASLLLAAWCGVRAWRVLLGKIYWGAQEVIYASMPGMRYADLCLGVLTACAGLGLLASGIRMLRGKAAREAKAFFLSLAALEVLYGAARYFISGMTLLDWPALGRIAVYIFMALVHSSYYKEKKAEILQNTTETGGEANEGCKDPLCGDSLLQGGGSSAGDGETAA